MPERSELGQFQKVTARWRPQRFDDLKAGAQSFIGREGVFEALWIIEDGPYAGQWAMSIPREWKPEQSESGLSFWDLFAWVPSGDLIADEYEKAAKVETKEPT